MPELPEVETVVRSLRPRAVGSTVWRVDLRRTDILSPCDADLGALLEGKIISAVDRRGKRIVFTLHDATRFYIHLGMSGRLTCESPEAAEAKHTHLILHVGRDPPHHDLSGGVNPTLQIRFVDPRRFGGVFYLGNSDHAQGLGPEPLSMGIPQLARALARTSRAVKTALLDQSLVAGLGNIYVDESLFLAKVHPQIPADQLDSDEIAALTKSMKRVLNKAIKHRGSTLRDYRDADNTPGGFQKLHNVYDREGEPCRVCKTPICRIVLGGRSTHFCKHCQRGSAADERG